jgi:hypothetical protein
VKTSNFESLYLCTSTPIIPNLKQKKTQFFTTIGYALKIIFKLKKLEWQRQQNVVKCHKKKPIEKFEPKELAKLL